MPITITSFLNLIPSSTISRLRSFLTKKGVRIYDGTFKLATVWTPVFILLIFAISVSNVLVDDIDMTCRLSRTGHHDQELIDHCWLYGTFLVVKLLKPECQGEVAYPGVGPYDAKKDEIYWQSYYNHIWLILGTAAFLSYVPNLIWKARGTKKIRGLSDLDGTLMPKERARKFAATIGYNSSFALQYLCCKILASFGILGAFLTFSHAIPGFWNYGWMHLVARNSDWPHPRDVVFPKVAKCTKSNFGGGGDLASQSAICELPMNVLSQWTFLILWFWLVVVFLCCTLSVIRLLYLSCSSTSRNTSMKKLCCSLRRDRGRDIDVNIRFGEWLVLSLVRQNIEEWQFSQFLTKFMLLPDQTIITQNEIELQPV